MDSLAVIPKDQDYYILVFPYYGTIVFYGTSNDAQALYRKMIFREGRGTIRLANPFNPHDREIVLAEIYNVKADRDAGIKDLPYLPHKKWA